MAVTASTSAVPTSFAYQSRPCRHHELDRPIRKIVGGCARRQARHQAGK
jgi:hypothetical protein